MHQKIYSVFFAFFMLFSLLLFSPSLLFASILENTLVKTPQGLVAVENIHIGDELIGYDKITKQITTVSVTEITTCFVNTIITITTDKGDIPASPNQLFYDPTTSKWMQAVNITNAHALLDSQLNQCACLKKEVTVIKPIKAYRITTSAPHDFFITEQEVLTHNFIPAFVVGLTWLFGAGGVEFVGAAITAGAAGALVGMEIKKRHDKNKIVFHASAQQHNQHEKNNGGGEFNPDPDDDKNSSFVERVSNTMTKTEFFKKMKKRYEHWRNGIYRRKSKEPAIVKNAEYLEWDHKHNDVEIYHKNEQHLGSLDPKTLEIYKDPVPNRMLPKG